MGVLISPERREVEMHQILHTNVRRSWSSPVLHDGINQHVAGTMRKRLSGLWSPSFVSPRSLGSP